MDEDERKDPLEDRRGAEVDSGRHGGGRAEERDEDDRDERRDGLRSDVDDRVADDLHIEAALGPCGEGHRRVVCSGEEGGDSVQGDADAEEVVEACVASATGV